MDRGKKKILAALGSFLTAMILCTWVSKSIYASQLPQVTVQMPQRMVVEHTVEAVGQVQAKRQLAISTDAGFLVKEVLVIPGDQIVSGQVLFLLDMDSLTERIEALEAEEEKLRLQIASCQKSAQAESEKQKQDVIRTQEDVNSALMEAEKQILRAQEDEAEAKEALEKHEKKEFWKAAEGGDETLKQQVYDAWEAERQALEEQVQTAARALCDAVDAAETVIRDSKRLLEDSQKETTQDVNLALLTLELTALEEERSGLLAWIDTGGEVCALQPGTVLQVNVAPGAYTTDGAAILYADTKADMQFAALLTREQKQFVEQGMTAGISFGNSREKIAVTVDYLTETEEGSGSWQVICKLTEGNAAHGQNGTFTLNAPSEQYACCVPLEAVYRDANQKPFVYVLAETETILGKELSVQKCMVEILDQNEKYAALSADSIQETSAVVTEATKEFAAGDVVRLKE